ncbi:MAG TPA: hypothetical protein PLE54_12985 [Burkholderiaceae bacterium]|nr:hypothetical protein [Burkholderiaceae bacterium]HQR71516.1 hypothetical protein [Burkholderiaceae bacterium]
MTLLLDMLAVVLVVGAVAYLWRGRRRGCAECAPRRAGAETRIALDELRSQARRAAGRR